MQITLDFTPEEKSCFCDSGVTFPGLSSPACAVQRSPRYPVIYSAKVIFGKKQKLYEMCHYVEGNTSSR